MCHLNAPAGWCWSSWKIHRDEGEYKSFLLWRKHSPDAHSVIWGFCPPPSLSGHRNDVRSLRHQGELPPSLFRVREQPSAFPSLRQNFTFCVPLSCLCWRLWSKGCCRTESRSCSRCSAPPPERRVKQKPPTPSPSALCVNSQKINNYHSVFYYLLFQKVIFSRLYLCPPCPIIHETLAIKGQWQ